MLPEWMQKEDQYIPEKGSHQFVLSTIKSIGKVMSHIRIQRGHEKGKTLPPLFKLCLMITCILLLSVTQNRILILVYIASVLAYLSFWPPIDILHIIKAGVGAATIAFLIMLPAMIFNHQLIYNDVIIIVKVFFSVVIVSIYNHTTQWNHVTQSLRTLHIPGLFIFTLDISLKYIVLLGNLIIEILTSLQLRSVGKNHQKYQSVGGVMGVTFIRGSEMTQQMYEAMLCRGFSDDYKGL